MHKEINVKQVLKTAKKLNNLNFEKIISEFILEVPCLSKNDVKDLLDNDDTLSDKDKIKFLYALQEEIDNDKKIELNNLFHFFKKEIKKMEKQSNDKK